MAEQEHEFTTGQIEASILRALTERCFDVIPGLIKLLALQDPKRAGEVLEEINAGLAAAERLAAGGLTDEVIMSSIEAAITAAIDTGQLYIVPALLRSLAAHDTDRAMKAALGISLTPDELERVLAGHEGVS